MRTLHLWQACILALFTGAWLMKGFVWETVILAMLGGCLFAPLAAALLWDKFPRVSRNVLAFNSAAGVLFAFGFLLDIRSSIHTESVLLGLLVMLFVVFFSVLMGVLAVGSAISITAPEIVTLDEVKKLTVPTKQWIFDSMMLQGSAFASYILLGRKNSEAIFVVIAGTLGLLWMAYVAPQRLIARHSGIRHSVTYLSPDSD